MSFFSKTRLRATELFADSFEYLQRTYDQARETFTPASPFGQILTVVANLGEMIFFYIEAVATEYTSLFDASQGFQKAHVTTAVALTDDMNAKVLAKVKELTGKEALIENTIDESILGGFILRVGDLQYNASIANNFNKLKRTFSQN